MTTGDVLVHSESVVPRVQRNTTLSTIPPRSTNFFVFTHYIIWSGYCHSWLLEISTRNYHLSCYLAEMKGLFGGKTSGGCTDGDSMLAGDGGTWMIPFHFTEAEYGTPVHPSLSSGFYFTDSRKE
jgi:hypothetical protein